MGNRKLGILAMVATLGLAACDSGVAGNDMTRVRVLLTDAPGDLAVAEVTISEIYMQGAEGRVTLFNGPETFNLLDLQNGVTAQLAEVLIPRGQYSQARMVVQSASITTEDGRTYSTQAGTLHCPSCMQSGLKVNMPGGSVRLEEESEVLVFDFDVSQSFGREAGRSGRWVMHPVIHASEFTTASVIRGQVSLAEGVTLPESCGTQTITRAHFVPTATAGEIKVSGLTAADGAFRFSFVAPGSYTLGYEETISFDNGDTLGFTATFTPETLNVGASENVTAAYTITGATCTLAS
jgi:hypothetical protein